MKCTFNWCTEERNPAIGIANLKGVPGFPTVGTAGQYPLCRWHYTEALDGNWKSVVLQGWEAFPGMDEPADKPHVTVSQFLSAAVTERVAEAQKVVDEIEMGLPQVIEGVIVEDTDYPTGVAI